MIINDCLLLKRRVNAIGLNTGLRTIPMQGATRQWGCFQVRFFWPEPTGRCPVQTVALPNTLGALQR